MLPLGDRRTTERTSQSQLFLSSSTSPVDHMRRLVFSSCIKTTSPTRIFREVLFFVWETSYFLYQYLFLSLLYSFFKEKWVSDANLVCYYHKQYLYFKTGNQIIVAINKFKLYI
jgi:hypothetical protein